MRHPEPNGDVSSTQRRRERRESAEKHQRNRTHRGVDGERVKPGPSLKHVPVFSAFPLRSLRLCVENAFRFEPEAAGLTEARAR